MSSKKDVVLFIQEKETSIVANTLVISPSWLIPEKWTLIMHEKDQYFIISSVSKQYLHIQKTLGFYNVQISTLSNLWTLENDTYLYQFIDKQKYYIYLDTSSNTIQASPTLKSTIKFHS